ncbi:VOC family protein [Tsukamurella tyrosinosolvens]|uniref:VOC family protein n=1 Tax=Tsukamurella tyrosinosolvens TaxID=57704 RepID=UPI00125EDED1|nr:VOC family protein [Tsukamurella tyrosinosolvens]
MPDDNCSGNRSCRGLKWNANVINGQILGVDGGGSLGGRQLSQRRSEIDTSRQAEVEEITRMLNGIHHLKLPVTDLIGTQQWWDSFLGAKRVTELDHVDPQTGALFGIVLEIPGVHVPIELRLARGPAMAIAGFDPITFAAADREALRELIQRANRLQIENSGMLRGALGWMAAFRSRDDLILHIYTVEQNTFNMAGSDQHSPWLQPLSRDL